MTAASMIVMRMKLRSRRERGERKRVIEDFVLWKICDREKEAAMKWWYTYRLVLISESGDVDDGKEQEGQGPLGTVLLASSSWFTKRRREIEKAKDMDATGEENQLSNSPVLSRLLTNEMKQFSRYWCFGIFFGLKLEFVVGVCMTW
jgi:hypothetical protein